MYQSQFSGSERVDKFSPVIAQQMVKYVHKVLGQIQWRSRVFIVNYEHTSHLFLVFIVDVEQVSISWVVANYSCRFGISQHEETFTS